jgi:hypothetical protein
MQLLEGISNRNIFFWGGGGGIPVPSVLTLDIIKLSFSSTYVVK